MFYALLSSSPPGWVGKGKPLILGNQFTLEKFSVPPLPFSESSEKLQWDTALSRATLAHIDAADTHGYNESAFLATVIFNSGKILSNFA